ncbi:MAG TPA: SUMF1/EgtB/PvdO family nonheme iron enzyme [Anaerolineales bacterium]|nr:SUMF1/EgtB/PvdO family nonheme iron enzyme [Anaerolineales bacterium]
MHINFRSYKKLFVVMFFALFIVGGCTSTSSPQSTEALPTSVPQIMGIIKPFAGNVKVIDPENQEKVVQIGESIEIKQGDRITQDDEGQSTLNFGNLLEIELLKNTELTLNEIKTELGDSISVVVYHEHGHIRLRQSPQASVKLIVINNDMEIKTREKGTEFIVCYAPGILTCGDVMTGEISMISGGVEQIIPAGHFSYANVGQPPDPPLCSRPEELLTWLDKMRTNQKVGDLGQLVQSWPEALCGAPTEEISNLPTSAGMVRIEAGTYKVGVLEPNEFHLASQEIPLPEFWIDIYEVTNANFQLYLEETGDQPPATWPGQANHPVKGVTWNQASAYCEWANKRLPTEAEWEVAGRGPGQNPPLFPWGNDSEAGGEIDNLPRTDTYDVGSHPFNQSTFGVHDLVGNVWEWVGDPYAQAESGKMILRGGRYGLIRDLAYRQLAAADDPSFTPFAGFRCATNQIEVK